AQLTDHSAQVLQLGLTRDGKVLAEGNFDKTAKLWDMASREKVLTMGGFDQGVRSVAITGDGKIVAAGSMNIIKLWDIKKGAPSATQTTASPAKITAGRGH